MEIATYAFMPWSEENKENIESKNFALEGGFLEFINNSLSKKRTQLKFCDSSIGIVARLDIGFRDLTSKKIVIFDPSPVMKDLKEPAKEVAVLEDSYWTLLDGMLTHFSNDGERLESLLVKKAQEFFMGGDCIWLHFYEDHDFENSILKCFQNGKITATVKWNSYTEFFADKDGYLYSIHEPNETELVTMSPQGELTYTSSKNIKLFDQLLFVDRKTNRIIVHRDGWIMCFENEVLVNEISVLNAGLDNTGNPFVSGQKDKNILLTFVEKEEEVSLGLEIFYQNLSVKSIEENELLASAGTSLFKIRPNNLQEIKINNEVYSQQIFPKSWVITDKKVDEKGETLYLATSGPKGMAVIQIKLN